MNASRSECACGCGEFILTQDPSADFKYPHCQSLWLSSVDQDDPVTWRAEQRILTMLVHQTFEWRYSPWEFEWTDLHIGRYDERNEGDVARGLSRLYFMYEDQIKYWGQGHALPVLVRG